MSGPYENVPIYNFRNLKKNRKSLPMILHVFEEHKIKTSPRHDVQVATRQN